jgi:ferredoxin
VTVCPVDCFVEGPNFLAINPEECIDCGVCIPECPVDAIFAEGDIPQEEFDKWLKINTELSLVKKWPVITKMKPAMPDAAEWADRKDKLEFLLKE